MLPITRVRLFKHGVAYFERSGSVQGEELLELDFKALGDGERRLSLSYVVEAPVWKTSYRIILPDSIAHLAHHEVRNLVARELISTEAREALETIADRVDALTRLQQTMANNKAWLGRIEQGQERLRKNLQALGNSTAEARLRDRYVTKLSDEEEQIEALSAENTGLQQEVERAQQAIEALIEELTL